MNDTLGSIELPPRISASFIRRSLLVVTIGGIAWSSLASTGVSVRALLEGVPSMVNLASEMWPPDFSRLPSIGRAIMTTAQIAMAGTSVGLCISLAAGVLASHTQTPAQWLRPPTTALLAAVRTVPELLWALVFVVSVGPGAFAGVIAICLDTFGFAGRFFAEALDNVDPGPQDALKAHGASRWLLLFGVVLPLATPALLHTSLYSLERAIRASVVLGIVGAGGIGIELKVAMDLFEYRRAAAMVICILVVVVAVEAFGTWIRHKLLPSTAH